LRLQLDSTQSYNREIESSNDYTALIKWIADDVKNNVLENL